MTVTVDWLHCETTLVMVTVIVAPFPFPFPAAATTLFTALFCPPLCVPVAAVVTAVAEEFLAWTTVAVALTVVGAVGVEVWVDATPIQLFSWFLQSETAKEA